jgi:hypothetical protein
MSWVHFFTALWAVFGIAASARGDLGHDSVFYEGQIGPHHARVTIRMPGVIPGLAEISVRVLKGEVREVTVLPLIWKLGREGAPPPDQALPVRGESDLYSAQLWFMESGAHSVEVRVRGSAGEGSVLVPVNAVARRVSGLPHGLAGGLGLLGLILVLLLLGIVGAAIREGVVVPGESPSRRQRWAARATVAGVAVLLSLLLWGGWRWWEAEAAMYRNNRLYRPVPSEATIDETSRGTLLRLFLEEPKPHRASPLVPDHGRLMHLFLLREPGLDAMAHLHPIRVHRRLFETPVPSLPPGSYSVYAQVTHETGFAQTITNRVELPIAAVHSESMDEEDAWWVGTTIAGKAAPVTAPLGDGLTMEWLMEGGPSSLRDGPTSLRFVVRDAAGRPVQLEPYLGMAGHLVVRSLDGRIFSHVHPGGSFSMASQQLFELRDAGKAPREVVFGANDPTCKLPGLEESTEVWFARKPSEPRGEVSFPYEFVQSKSYRVWVQVRVDGRIRTGAFDLPGELNDRR